MSSFSYSTLPLRYRTRAFANKLFERLRRRIEGAADCIVAAARSLAFTKLIVTRLVHEAPNGSPAKRCIFCNGLGVTKEHIWAEWLNPYLPKSIVNHEIYSETIFPDRTEATIKKRSGSPQSGRIRRVCRCCNTGWMSLLQEDTKPILLPLVLGEVSSLHKNNQSKSAAWIAMFTMVSEFIDKTETRIGIPATERLFLKEKQIVPPNWKKWIGNYRSEKWKGVWLHGTIPIKSEKHIPKKHDSGLYLPNTQTTTFLVAALPIRRTASITFDAGTNTWINTVPASGNVDNIFFDGMALPVRTGGLPGGGVTPVWNGTFSTSIPNVNIQWAWGAAVYTHFTTAYNSLNVKATHQNCCGGNNGDQAGTPENTADQSGLVGGATGGGAQTSRDRGAGPSA